jgi:hypothetical protein
MADVATQISLAQGYAADVKAQADSAISDMRADIDNIGFTLVSFSGANLPDAPEIPELLTAPTLSPVNLELPTEPNTAPVFLPISPIDPGITPELTVTPPTLVLPVLPGQAPEFTVTPPSITTDFTFPDLPAELINPVILAPTLPDRAEPAAPTIALPSFDGVAPTGDLTAPTDLAGQMVAAYNDVRPAMVAALGAHTDAWLTQHNPQFFIQLQRIEDQLATYLAGGTGLSSDIEDAIYERAKDREVAEARRTSRAAYANAAARGFTIPDGAAFSQDARARQAASDNLARSANEIAIKQAEMEQANLQFAVTTSAGLRQAALSASLSYHSNLISLNGQALEYARNIVANVVEVYNLTVRAFSAKLEAYRAEAAVYDTRLKAALASLDVYRTQIDALRALSDVDRSKVEVYRAQLGALETRANIYRTQVQTIVERANLERLKVDLFRTRVEAYVATVQGKRAEYDGYSAALSGQEALVRIYGTQVDAYKAELDGFRAKIDAQAATIRAQSETNDALATRYKAELDAYSTVVDARGKKATLELDVQRAELNTFEVQTRAALETVRLQATVYESNARIILQNTQLEVETLIKNAQMVVERARTVAELGVASAKVYEGMAGAALSGMNTLVAATLAE